MTGGSPARRTRSRGAALAAVLGLLATAPATAEGFPVRSPGRPTFVANALALPRGADSARVDVTWEIPLSQLTFRGEDDWYRARYDVTIVLALGSKQVAGDVWERRVRVASFAETRGNEVAKGRRSFTVPIGLYDVRLTVTDRASRQTSAARAKLAAYFGPSRIGLSEIRFLRYTGEGAVSNPRREVPVGETGHVARLTLHPEDSEGGTFRLSWSFSSPAQRDASVGDSTVTLAAEPLPVEIAVPAGILSPGVHQLDVRLEGTDEGVEESRKTTFVVRLTPQWFTTHRDEALEVLEILATRDELRVLREASGAEWAERVDAFWSRHDPAPESGINEFRESIQERMEAAASLFDEPFRRPGWRTDRGRIFVKYGRPDRRTVRAADFDGPASELWEYDSPRRLFFFVDERGNGELWLRG